jgi:hypothetical protein
MSKFTSECQFQRAMLVMVVILVVGALGFYFLQNYIGLIGGKIALSKMVWLAYAVLFWLGFPLFIVLDPRTSVMLGHVFRFLLMSMVARGFVEFWMLYVSNNWSPLYGIAHDVFCIAGLVFFLTRAWQNSEWRACQPSGELFIHGIVTTLLFLPEIYFAWYMRMNFNTQGGNAIYFVPDVPQHKLVLIITASIDIVLTIYLMLFLRYWFYGQTNSKHT